MVNSPVSGPLHRCTGRTRYATTKKFDSHVEVLETSLIASDHTPVKYRLSRSR